MRDDRGGGDRPQPHLTGKALAAKEERAAREAKALRANLLRRKAQKHASKKEG